MCDFFSLCKQKNTNRKKYYLNGRTKVSKIITFANKKRDDKTFLKIIELLNFYLCKLKKEKTKFST